MTRLIILVALCGLLAACASQGGPSPVSVQQVLVPVPMPCAVDPGPKPDFPDTAAALHGGANILARAKLYAEGRQMRIGWIARLEAANTGCQAVK